MLGLVGQGLANKQIARRLGIAERTVKAHLTSVFQASASPTGPRLPFGRRSTSRAEQAKRDDPPRGVRGPSRCCRDAECVGQPSLPPPPEPESSEPEPEPPEPEPEPS